MSRPIALVREAAMGGPAASFVKNNGYGGVMVYNVTNDSTGCLSQISQALYDESTVAKPGCLS